MRRLPEEGTPAEDVGGYRVADHPGERHPLLSRDSPEFLVVRSVEGDGDPANRGVTAGGLPAVLHHDAPLWCTYSICASAGRKAKQFNSGGLPVLPDEATCAGRWPARAGLKAGGP